MTGTMGEALTTPEAGPRTPMFGPKAGPATRTAPPPAGGAVYGLGMIGALVFFVGVARTRQDYILAVGKAAVWPALLVFKAFKTLGG